MLIINFLYLLVFIARNYMYIFWMGFQLSFINISNTRISILSN